LPGVPSQTFNHRATADAPVDAVWARLDQPETWESIGGVGRVYDPKIDEEGRLVGFSFDTIAGGRKYVGVATPHERVEHKRMSWHVQNSEVTGVASVTLDPSDTGTVITVTLHVESVGLLSSMLFPLIATAIGSGLASSVDSFAASFET
jgi:carbon monoxide dehydrogenase subunit G